MATWAVATGTCVIFGDTGGTWTETETGTETKVKVKTETKLPETIKKQQGQRKAAHRLGSTGCHLMSGPETEKETQFQNENETEARLRRRLRLVSSRLRRFRCQGLTLSAFCVTLSIFSVK